MLIDATHAEETRVVVVDGNKVEEFDFESQFKRQLAGNIYLAKVTRVEPSLQAAFVDYGGNRHGFLAFSEIHPDYYQIPVADRLALIEEEKAYAASQKAEEEDDADTDAADTAQGDDGEDSKPKPRVRRTRRSSRNRAASTSSDDATATRDIAGMETIDLDDPEEGSSPMELVAETPVDTPANDEAQDDDQVDGADDSDADSDDQPAEIENVDSADDSDDVRPVRKPRPKRYKIQEVVKVRQIMLVQVVKEERGNKGAALTTYLSLAGRYCVLMPNTARGGGISRKITNVADRKKLKEIAGEMLVPEGAGLIIRTAGSQRTRNEIKRDYEYLQRMWETIRELTLKSIAPAKIYEEGDLIKRTIRDLYSKDIDEVIVAGEEGYRNAKDFMRMIMPSHAKHVKQYAEQMPLFARYQCESYLSGMFNPTVQLPSGGYIVIGVTEALVAIDVNSGRATKEGSIEQTALKTNLEAADEVARQARLRDLAGLIVIDFIDMDERRNNIAVEKRFKDALKTDRARIQVGRISGFGLLEMSRQRLRPGMLEATTQPCSHCHGTGLLRSDDNVVLNILRQIEEEGTRGRSKEVLVRAPVSIANVLMNGKRDHIAGIEAQYGMSVRVECDLTLVSPDFAIDKFKTATRAVPEALPFVPPVQSARDLADELVFDEVEEEEAAPAAADTPAQQNGDAATPGDDDADGQPRKKRRRRRRRKGGQTAENGENGENGENADESATDGADQDAAPVDAPDAPADAAEAAEAASDVPAEKPKRTRSRRKPKAEVADAQAEADTPDAVAETAPADQPAADADAPAEKPKRTRSRRKPKAEVAEGTEAPAEADAEATAEKPKPARRSRARKPKAEAAPVVDARTDVPAVPADAPADAPATDAPIADAPVSETPAPASEAAPEVKSDPIAAPEPVAEPAPATEEAAEPASAPEPTPAPEAPAPEAPAEDAESKPKKRGWWSLGR
ncbi:Rne/Rng family ribonuclease [Loktanella sp. R86503]|uniref:Rne/Rng family ribonuclease n=1 Tax=Loktanella sp. R86503 TaxID=3093847 RepID=UPI0036D8936D